MFQILVWNFKACLFIRQKRSRNFYLTNSHFGRIQEVNYLLKSSFLKFLFYENTRRFEIHEVSQNALAANEVTLKQRIESNPSIKVYSDITGFRKKMQLYPDYYSHLWEFIDLWLCIQIF